MSIKPLLDRVVLQVEEAEEKTKSGIILSSAAASPHIPASIPALCAHSIMCLILRITAGLSAE